MLALAGIQRGDMAALRKFLALTILGGVSFLGMPFATLSHFY